MLTSLEFELDLLGTRNAIRQNVKIEQGAQGVRLICRIMERTTALDISAADTLEICLRAPSQADTVLTATFLTDGTDGRIYADTLVGTLTEIGGYKITARVASSTATYDRKSPSFGTFNVVAPLCP